MTSLKPPLSVIELRHESGHVLWLRFDDGSRRTVDCLPLLWGPVFEPLRNADAFAAVRLDKDLGVPTWGDVDIAPEALAALPDVSEADAAAVMTV